MNEIKNRGVEDIMIVSVDGLLTDEVKVFIEKCLQEDEKEHIKKQHHTARRIYNRLVEELNFTGGESTIRRYVQQVKTTVYIFVLVYVIAVHHLYELTADKIQKAF